jgi:hypothetical protein
MHLTQARRVVLLSFNKTTRTIDFRHYLITVRPVGVSRNLRRLSTTSSALPNLSSATDVADLLLNRDGGSFVSSASEAESDASGEEGGSKVVLPQPYVGRSNKKSEKRAIRLTELGPRLELGLLKIEDGLGGGDGETLYHEFGTSSPVSVIATYMRKLTQFFFRVQFKRRQRKRPSSLKFRKRRRTSRPRVVDSKKRTSKPKKRQKRRRSASIARATTMLMARRRTRTSPRARALAAKKATKTSLLTRTYMGKTGFLKKSRTRRKKEKRKKRRRRVRRKRRRSRSLPSAAEEKAARRNLS